MVRRPFLNDSGLILITQFLFMLLAAVHTDFYRLSGQGKAGARSMPAAHAEKTARWTPDENIRRYRRLLMTPLTDLERQFVERRLAQEQRVSERAGNEEMPVHSNAT